MRRGGNLWEGWGFVAPDVYAASGAFGRGRSAPSSFEGVNLMKTVLKLTAVACLVTLGACNRNTANEQKADNIEAATENAADSLDALAGNTGNEAVADSVENRADAVRDAGQNAADAVRDADRNTNNVEANTVGM
jgi:hypothetical protein